MAKVCSSKGIFSKKLIHAIDNASWIVLFSPWLWICLVRSFFKIKKKYIFKWVYTYNKSQKHLWFSTLTHKIDHKVHLFKTNSDHQVLISQIFSLSGCCGSKQTLSARCWNEAENLLQLSLLEFIRLTTKLKLLKNY